MRKIKKSRPEWFGGLVFNEKPGFVAYFDNDAAKRLKIKNEKNFELPENVFSTPMDAHLAVTTRCNLYCKGCYNTIKSDEKTDMDFEKGKRIIDNLSYLNVFSISFGGGEPTLYKNLFDLAWYAREKNILPNITTNGVNMTAELAKQMKVFGNVHLSLHNMSDMNHIEKAARLLKKAHVKSMGLNFLLCTNTVDHIEEVFSFAKKHNFSKILCLRYKQTEKNEKIDGMSIDDKYIQSYNQFASLAKKIQNACID